MLKSQKCFNVPVRTWGHLWVRFVANISSKPVIHVAEKKRPGRKPLDPNYHVPSSGQLIDRWGGGGCVLGTKPNNYNNILQEYSDALLNCRDVSFIQGPVDKVNNVFWPFSGLKLPRYPPTATVRWTWGGAATKRSVILINVSHACCLKTCSLGQSYLKARLSCWLFSDRFYFVCRRRDRRRTTVHSICPSAPSPRIPFPVALVARIEQRQPHAPPQTTMLVSNFDKSKASNYCYRSMHFFMFFVFASVWVR